MLFQPLAQRRLAFVAQGVGYLGFVLPQPVFQLGLNGNDLDRILCPTAGEQIGRDVLLDGVFAGRAFPFAIQYHQGASMAALIRTQ